jgi:hypothetical protein
MTRSNQSAVEHLQEVLTRVLPASPDDAINGTELLDLVRRAGLGSSELADNSLRSTFSRLAGDETSVIAKVDGRHGYYLRGETEAPSAGYSTLGEGGRDQQREEKFRAVFMAWSAREEQFPVHIEHTRAARQSSGLNLWKFPDVVSVQWDVLDQDSQGRSVLDAAVLEVRKSLGEPPFRITSAELKTDVSAGTLRQVFFQCVSNSRWAHTTELVIASDVSDQSIANELRRLGASYGVSVRSFSLAAEELDKLPAAKSIKSADEVENCLDRPLEVKNIVASAPRDVLDWEHIKDMQQQHEDFRRIFSWISRCMSDRRPYDYQFWLKNYG